MHTPGSDSNTRLAPRPEILNSPSLDRTGPFLQPGRVACLRSGGQRPSGARTRSAMTFER
ncbi:hypothetical protein ACFPRL_25045 [Pseudoclavibacter helvolus]